MSKWYPASNYTPADSQSVQALPDPGSYTDLVTGDMCLVNLNGQTDVLRYDSTSSATQNVPLVVTPDGNAGNGRWLKVEYSKQNKNGFDTQQGPVSDSFCTLGVAGTTFTLTHVADYNIFVQGAQFTVTGNETVEITDVHGLHWIYFDNTGTLQIQAPGGDTEPLIMDNCLVTAVYWDAVGNSANLMFDERHGSGMSPATHHHLHETMGAQYNSGLGLSAFDIDGSGNNATAAQFDLNSGTLHDEDNEIDIAADTDATIDTFYRLGVGGPWFKATATATFPVADGTVGTQLDWNDYNGGTWQLLEITSGRYVLTHYFATNDVLGGGVIGIMGQNTYINKNAARTGAEVEMTALLLGDLPIPEILPIATVIWQTNSGYSNQVAARTISTDLGDDYIDWRQVSITSSGITVGDHESLAGLLGGAASDHYHLTGAQETDLTDGGNTVLHDHNSLIDSAEVGAVYTASGAAQLNYNGTEVAATKADGVSIKETTTGKEVDISVATAGGDVVISAKEPGSGIELQARNVADDADLIIFEGTPETGFDLRCGSSGARVLSNAGQQIKFWQSNQSYYGYLEKQTNHVILGNNEPGQDVRVYVRNVADNADDLAIKAVADGKVALYYDGVAKLQTTSEGIDVFGGGIGFPATAVPSTDVNTLDDYEEGSWTPTAADAGSGGNTTTTGTGYYVKIGSMVSVWGHLLSVSTAGLTAGNGFYIQGLPFVSSSDTPLAYGACVLTSISTTEENYAVQQSSGNSAVRIRASRTNSSSVTVIVSQCIDGATGVQFTMQYRI